jgi:catechol 2,3-dioxygenase-like lactoylglutathione lyase family enzyme
MRRPALVPELMVTDIAASLAFWCGPCGFRVVYDRPEEGFACTERDGSRVMLDALPAGRPHRWAVAVTEPPSAATSMSKPRLRRWRRSWRRWMARRPAVAASRLTALPRHPCDLEH